MFNQYKSLDIRKAKFPYGGCLRPSYCGLGWVWSSLSKMINEEWETVLVLVWRHTSNPLAYTWHLAISPLVFQWISLMKRTVKTSAWIWTVYGTLPMLHFRAWEIWTCSGICEQKLEVVENKPLCPKELSSNNSLL